MRKLFVCLSLVALCLMACSSEDATGEAVAVVETETEVVTEEETAEVVEAVESGNYTDEMKIPYTVDLDEYGADSVERTGDVVDSPYYYNLDFYNMEDSDTLSIITNFKTQQQTSEWSCGISAMMMVLEYYDSLGDYNEESLSAMRANGSEPGATTLIDLVNIYEELGGFDVVSTYDFEGDEVYEYMTLDKVRETLMEDIPIAFAWNDWGGHWQVMIGYDTMGTETYSDDVIIVADSYDTTDHNQDGYGVYSAERLYYNWTMYDFFTENYDIEERDLLFVIATPEE